jgi:Stage II sporulation protein E (SpoIIE)
VSPLHSSRREARVLCARAVAAVAAVCAVPALVAALTVGEPLASAASTKPPPPGKAAPPPATEPSLPAEPVPPPPVETTATPPPPQPIETPPPPPAAEPEPAPAEELAPAEETPAPEPKPAPAPKPVPVKQPPVKEPPAPEEQAAPGPVEQAGPPREAAAQRDVGPPSDRKRAGDSGSDKKRKLLDKPAKEPEADEDPDFGEAPEADEDPGAAYWRSNPDGWQFRLTVASLTGVIGDVGGGDEEEEEEERSTAPTLTSAPVAVALPELSGLEDLPIATPAPSPPNPEPSSPPNPEPPSSESPPDNTEPPATEDPVPNGDGDAAGGTGAAGGATGTAAPGADGGAGAGTAAGAPIVPAPALGADFDEPVGQAEGGADGSANAEDLIDRTDRDGDGDEELAIIRPVERLVENVPNSLKFALAALGALSLMLGLGYLFAALRARSLARQRRDLLKEVGLLQSALLPPVPEKVGSLRTSVAYRPADGPGAGGDFYDVLPLAGGGAGFILGDVSGHGRGALARTAFMRYTLRAYLEAGLEPRAALKVAGRVIDENLGGDFATVLLAVHDPETGSLTYATAGHPAPIVVGPQVHHPVTAGSSPPIGVGVPTGLRQTTVPLVSGSVACLFTDGLMEARSEGGILGRDRLERMLADMGDDATARGLIERVSQEARVLSDDIAAVVVSPVDGVPPAAPRTEQLELTPRELEGPLAHRFLGACGLSEAEVASAVARARALAGGDGAVLNVVLGERPQVEVLPRGVEGIEAASRRAAGIR